MKVFKRPQGKASDMCPTCNRGKQTVNEVKATLNQHTDEDCPVRKHLASLLDLGTESANSIVEAQERVRIRREHILETANQTNLSPEDFMAQFSLTDPSSFIPCACVGSVCVGRLHDLTDSLCYFYHHYHLKDQRRWEHKQEIEQLKPGKLLIVFDFKANLVINRGPVEVGLRYYNRKHQSLMGFAIYERLADSKLRMYYIDVISNCLSHDSHAALEQVKLALSKALSLAQAPVTEISFWSDTGGHFMSHSFVSQIITEVPVIIKQHLVDRGVSVPDSDISVILNFFVESHGKSTVDSHFSVTGSYLDDIVAIRDVYTTSQLIAYLQQRYDEGEKLAVQEKRESRPVVICEWKPSCFDAVTHDHFADPNIVNSDDLDIVSDESPADTIADATSGSSELIDTLPARRQVVGTDGTLVPEGKCECHTSQAACCYMEFPAHELDLSYQWSCPSWKLYQSLKKDLLAKSLTLPASRKTATKTHPDLKVLVKLTSTVGECREIKPTAKVLLNHTHSLSFGARLTLNNSVRFSSNLIANVKDRASHVKTQSQPDIEFVAATRKRAQTSTQPSVHTDESAAEDTQPSVTQPSNSPAATSLANNPPVSKRRVRDFESESSQQVIKRARVDSVSAPQHHIAPDVTLLSPVQTSQNQNPSSPSQSSTDTQFIRSPAATKRSKKRNATNEPEAQPDAKRPNVISTPNYSRPSRVQVSNQHHHTDASRSVGLVMPIEDHSINTSSVSYPSLSDVNPSAAFDLTTLIGSQLSSSTHTTPSNPSLPAKPSR
jgi:hypothetical protein